MSVQQLTKTEIAESQLDVALTFYLEGRELISVITLAGAAEEILGNLCVKQDRPTSFEHQTRLANYILNKFFGIRTNEKEVGDSMNETRNELKHLMSGKANKVDVEFEAGELIARAIGNYECLLGTKTDKMCLFELKHREASERLFPKV